MGAGGERPESSDSTEPVSTAADFCALSTGRLAVGRAMNSQRKLVKAQLDSAGHASAEEMSEPEGLLGYSW